MMLNIVDIDESNSYSQLKTFDITTDSFLSQTLLVTFIQFSSAPTSIVKNRS